MSAINQPRRPDPRIIRSRSAATEAARTLLLQHGYAATTMDDIAARAGLSKRTLYNHYRDKEALFTQVVRDVMAYAESFARELSEGFAEVDVASLPLALHDLGQRLARAILRPDVVALRRLLIRESPAFPGLPEEYFVRAPSRVMAALAAGFGELGQAQLLHLDDPSRAAEQFAYLVVGGPLDRAMLLGEIALPDEVAACAREGVETFLARYAPGRAPGTGRSGPPGPGANGGTRNPPRRYKGE